ncbi:MAG: ThuA domain-containing protein [Candidatus Hydrogenedentota bacterium]
MKLLLLVAITLSTSTFAAPIKALIVDGQNNHDWRKTTPDLEQILLDTDLFTVDVATSPREGKDNSDFNPKFKKYDVIVLNYNGDLWNQKTQDAFENYIKNSGGVVVVHAADNAFRDWQAYNEIIGFGGWGNRSKKFGPYIHWVDGELVYDHESDGPGGGHECFAQFIVDSRDLDHPIMQDMPAQWFQTDELYNFMRGPGKNMHVLATAYSKRPRDNGGSGKHEPMLFTIKYGKGDIFHTTLGHDVRSLRDKGFQVTFARGAQWAATGKVTIPIPKGMPAVLKPNEAIRTFDGITSAVPLVDLYTQLSEASGDPAKLAALEQDLVSILSDSQATLLGVQAACDGLGLIGTEKAVPELAKLLTASPEYSDAARLALERIDHLDAGAVLINALDEISDGNRAGLINSLGKRREAAAIPPLTKIAQGNNIPDSDAAVRSLGRIGSKKSMDALYSLGRTDISVLKAVTQCAMGLLEAGDTEQAASIFQSVLDSHSATPALRNAALNGYISADPENGMLEVWVRLASPLTSASARSILGALPVEEDIVREIADHLDDIPVEQQIELLPLLAGMGHKAALPEILRLAKSGPTIQLRQSAVSALAKIPGNEDSVHFLADTAVSGRSELRDSAHAALIRSPGSAVDDAVIAGIDNTDRSHKLEYINVASARRLSGANPTLLTLVASDNEEIRIASLNALTIIGGTTEYPRLLTLVSAVPEPELATMVKAIRHAGAALNNQRDRFTAYSTTIEHNKAPVQSALLPGLVDMPSANSVALAKHYAQDKTTAVREAAIETLANWPNESSITTLLDLAEDAKSNETRTQLMTAFSTAIRKASESSIDTQLIQCERALNIGLDLEGKRVLLATIRNIKDLRSLTLLETLAEDPALEEEARAAMPAIKVALLEAPALDASHGKRQLARAVDGDPNTRWSTGTSMKPGMWLMINLRMPTTISGITLDTTKSSGDYPRGYDVYISDTSDNRGTKVASGKGTKPITTIKLDKPVKGQYITVVQTGSNGLYWSIHELSVDHMPDNFVE